MSENSSELDMFETSRRSFGGDEIERIRAETARLNAEAEKIKAETARLAAQDAAARRRMEEEELTKWEYTRADVRDLEKLNQLGGQGWKMTGQPYGTANEYAMMMRPKRSRQKQSDDFSYNR